jgi:hypothetical protein
VEGGTAVGRGWRGEMLTRAGMGCQCLLGGYASKIAIMAAPKNPTVTKGINVWTSALMISHMINHAGIIR